MVRARCSLAVLCVLAVGLFVGFAPSSAWAQSCGSGNIDDEQFQQVSAGGDHTCALGDNSLLLCWGDNGDGQTDSPTDGTFSAVAAGGSHSCAIDTAGDLRCWGADDNGQAPSFVQGPFAKVVAGAYHTCATDDAGQATCWGLTNYGQADPTGGSYVELALGTWVSCGRVSQGQAQCWGAQSLAPIPKGSFNRIALGDLMGCVIDDNSDLECWGGNGISQSPEGSWREVTVGGGHACAINYDDDILCWGDDFSGQADPNGDGVIADVTDPEGTKYTQVSAGAAHTCGIEQGSGNISCWGSNTGGQLAPGEGSETGARSSAARRSEQCEYGVETASCNGDCSASSCGDGTHNTSAGEMCDDGNTDSGDGCNSTCTSQEACGNGVLDPGEACDDGNTAYGDGCKGDCSLSDDCGDGVVQGGEDCDGGGTDTSTCDWNCTWPDCGDGIVNAAAGEECDDLVQTGALADSPNCDLDCTLPECGDDHQNQLAGEQCDEGGVNTSTCDHDCTLPKCGDGVVNASSGESCDDGNRYDGWGCLDDCSGLITAECGNSLGENGEECDAGPAGDQDCTASCRLTWIGKGKRAPEVKCINGINKAAGKLYGTLAKRQKSCLKARTLKGDQSPPEACLGADNKGKINKSESAVRSAELFQCVPKGKNRYNVPPFGYSGFQSVVDGVTTDTSAMLLDLFGEDLDATLTTKAVNKNKALCQNRVGVQTGMILKAKVDSYTKCIAKELLDDYMNSSTHLAQCLTWDEGLAPGGETDKDANKSAAKITKAGNSLAKTLAKQCENVNLASAFPGECSGEAEFRQCVDDMTDCRLCRIANAVSRMQVDCDSFDDGQENGTCTSNTATGVGEVGLLQIPDSSDVSKVLRNIDGGLYNGEFGEVVAMIEGQDVAVSFLCPGSDECEGIQINTVEAAALDLERTANMQRLVWWPHAAGYRLEVVQTADEDKTWAEATSIPVRRLNQSHAMAEYGGVQHHLVVIKSGNDWIRIRLRKTD